MSDERPTKARRVERWSKEKYSNPKVPSYVPPELLVYAKGKGLEALLLRAQYEDVSRLVQCQNPKDHDVYFQRQRPNHIVSDVDERGNRTNTPAQLLRKKKAELLEEITKMSKQYHQEAGSFLPGGKPKEITHKRYFKPHELEARMPGVIIGYRGTVHKMLQSDYNCKIVVEGKGMTKMTSDANMGTNRAEALRRAQEDPHVRITATEERALKKCLERIDWILSDDMEAQQFRENQRIELAKADGKYNPDTWVSGIKEVKDELQDMAGTGAAQNIQQTTNNEVDDILGNL